MIDGIPGALTVGAAVGSGLVAGVFFAFSTFVMKALAALRPVQGIAAMQSVNAAAPSPLFMAVLFGTAAACVALAGSALFRLDEAAAPYQLAGSLLYLVAVVTTIVYHVPRNDALATVDPNRAGAATHWDRYVAGWTAWNHVRTVASLAAAGTLTLGLGAGA